MEWKSYFNRFVGPFWHLILSPVIRMVFSSWCREGNFLRGNVMTCFQVERGGHRDLPAPAISQVTSGEKNQYGKSDIIWGGIF